MTRHTEDNTEVPEGEFVFEIIHRYVNAEYSQPEPDRKTAAEIPPGVKIWKHEYNCKKACDKLEKQRR